MEFTSLSYDFYNGLSGFKKMSLKGGDTILIHFDKTVDLIGDNETIEFKHVLYKSEFELDNNVGFVYKEIKLTDISGFINEYVHPYLR